MTPKKTALRLAQRCANRLGVHVRRREAAEPGYDVLGDADRLLGGDVRTVLDVGANVGRTADAVRGRFPDAAVHCFEPGGAALAELRRLAERDPAVTVVPSGVGAEVGELTLNESAQSDMSSFLRTGPAGWGTVVRTRTVPVTTVDAYCRDAGVDRVDLLKSDTQGFDLNVLRGAEAMLTGGAVRLVYLEINFAAIYADLPGPDAIFRHLLDRDFELVALYRMHYLAGRAGWTDGLFAHRSLRGGRAGGS